jgi:hypothetical protein
MQLGWFLKQLAQLAQPVLELSSRCASEDLDFAFNAAFAVELCGDMTSRAAV